jgi:hypothetical protein
MITIACALSSALPKLASAPTNGTIPTGSRGSITSFSGSSGVSSSSTLTSLLPIASILVEVLVLFVGVAVVGLFIIIVVANRADPDATGRRPQSVYFFAVSFVTLVTTIVGSVVVVFSVVDLIGRHGPGIGDAIARAVLIGGLITLLSGALLRTHLRRGVALAGPEAASPSRRVAQSYVSGVAFLSVLILLVVSILAVYLLFALGGPGVFGSFGGRTPALRDLIDTVYVGFVAGVVFVTHRNLVKPGLQLFGASKGRHAGASIPPAGPVRSSGPAAPTFDAPA